jgi:23S rRNA (cytidine1920-2'-O)/16S rRNA (cytidine1409-2'-O)-methyltransferase
MRIDHLLVSRGLFDSRSQAQAAIEAGLVTADGVVVKKASAKVADNTVIEAEPAHRWVGRGALKLDHALGLWPVAVEGRVVLDVGASTGGFTEVCLERGAARIYAVDVGHGQMHPRVSASDRVVNLDRTDARDLTRDLISETPGLIVCDASFIGLAKVLPAALELVEADADLVTLVKPQFEAERPGGSRKGVVKDAEARTAAVVSVSTWLESVGWSVQAATESPITGGDGNVEYLLWARKRR